MKIIGGLLQPAGGEVLLEGARVKGPDEQLIPGHPRIGYLSQHYELRNHYRVSELLDMANRFGGKDAEVIFELCRITHLLSRKTDQLSGGERQRIALARVLVASPSLLLLDEPFSNLDPIHKGILKEVLADVSAAIGITQLLASHEPHDTLSWADDMLVLRNGQVVQQGSPHAIYHEPVNRYVAAMFGAYSIIKPDIAQQLGIAPLPDPSFRMIRPERLTLLSPDAPEGLTGTVTGIQFYGSYSEVEVMVQGNPLIAFTQREKLRIGSAVKVAANPG
jgi:iron(III) transport system ATP-binding protein